MKKIVYVNSRIIGDDNYQRLIEAFPSVTFITNYQDSYEAEIIMNFPTKLTNEELKKYPNLKWIQLYSAGYNNLGSYAFENQNIKVCNARDVHSIPIAEDVILKMLLVNRNVKKYYENMKNSLWEPQTNEIELTNSTVGIIGVGSIGKEVAKKLKAFDVKILGYRRSNQLEENFDEIYSGEEGLKKVLELSDFLVLSLPLNDESYHMINKSTISLMKPTSVIINISRGEIINEPELIAALINKQIRAACLDVTEVEPLPKDSPLWGLDNVYISPHNSANSQYSRYRITNLLIENLDNYLNNRQLKNIVNNFD